MTGHLDGGGTAGNLNVRNNQIRNYCIANDKILFDFADIESYKPNGVINLMENPYIYLQTLKPLSFLQEYWYYS